MTIYFKVAVSRRSKGEAQGEDGRGAKAGRWWLRLATGEGPERQNAVQECSVKMGFLRRDAATVNT